MKKVYEKDRWCEIWCESDVENEVWEEFFLTPNFVWINKIFYKGKFIL